MTPSWEGSHMDSVWDGFQTELCPPSSHPLDPPPTPSPLWVTQPTALPRTTQGFVFFHHALCWSCEPQGINRPSLGLLNLVVGPGDKWRFGQSLCAIFHSSLACHVLVGDRAEPDRQRASRVATAHGRFEFLPLLVATWSAPDFRPWVTSTNLNKPAAAFARRLLPVRWRRLCLHVWER